jgi:hypothetical protein
VIGLNLCPFAKAVYVNDRIRYAVSEAESAPALLDDLEREMKLLAAASAREVETTLLIHPRVLGEFLDYNDFLGVADNALARLGLEGVLQIASFHPAYQFAGTSPDDVTNCTNRSPFPMLQLLREESIERAVSGAPEAEDIYQRNAETMRRLGASGWEIVAGTNRSSRS